MSIINWLYTIGHVCLSTKQHVFPQYQRSRGEQMEHFKYFEAVTNTPSPHRSLSLGTFIFAIYSQYWPIIPIFSSNGSYGFFDDVIPQDRQTEIKNGCQQWRNSGTKLSSYNFKYVNSFYLNSCVNIGGGGGGASPGKIYF